MTTVTIKDVAREAGVSVATVSRVLNGIGVDPAMAERVRASVTRLGYVPNNVGRALRRQQTNTWAVVVEELNAYIAGVVAAVEDAAESLGASVYLGITEYGTDRERRYLQTSLSHRVAGIIVARTTDTGAFADAPVPVVMVDRSYPEFGHDSVTLDNPRVGELVADHLVEQGFRRIAAIGNGQPGTPMWHRLEGLRHRLQAHGLTIRPEDERAAPPTLAGGRAAAAEILAQPDPPEALFCTNGPTTHGAFLALGATGARGVALVGTDDEEWTSLTTPPLTVVRQPVVEIGRRAAALLQERIDGLQGEPRQVVLEPELVVRESTLRR